MRWRGAGVALAATVLAEVVLTANASAALTYPNLVPDPPAPRPPSIYNDASGTRYLIRFDGYVHNAGPGAVELRGSSPFGPLDARLMTDVVQRVYDADGAGYHDLPTPAVLRYETTDGHQHWHLHHATRYSLWSYDRTTEVTPAHKIGFCLADVEVIASGASPVHYQYSGALVDRCSWLNAAQPATTGPNAGSTVMGISPGWRDVYEYILPLQWIDISNVAPGHYWLQTDVNPEAVILEDPEAPIDPPAYSAQASTIPGYVAQPVERGHVSANAPSTIALESERFGKNGSDADRWFKIVEQPGHGALTVAGQSVAGRWWPQAQVTYTPDRNYFGPDTFRFVAGDLTRLAYPLTPPEAAVTMQVGTGGPTALAISGAPAELVAGASAQLTATVTAGPSPHVTWMVEGVVGGDQHVGTVTQDGLFVAPAHVHGLSGDVMRVRATTEDGVSDEVAVRILPPPPPTPLPDVWHPAPPPAPPAPLGVSKTVPAGSPIVGEGRSPRVAFRPRAKLRGRRLMLVRIVPPRAGNLRIALRYRGRRVAGCIVPVTPQVVATCRIRVPRRFGGERRARLRVTVDLQVRGKVVQRWRLAPKAIGR